MKTDPMALLRQADPAGDVAAYDTRRAAALLERATAREPQRRRLRPGRRPLTAGLGAAVLMAGGGGLAWAVYSQPADTALRVQCAVSLDRADWDPEQPGGGVVLPSFSGDPVEDCAGEYRRLEGAAPALVAYDTGRVYVAVVPADWPVPPEWAPLPADFRNDPARVELAQRLDDLVEGPQAGCATAEQAEALARDELADLRLTGWTVQRLPQAAQADGDAWCAVAWVDEGPLPKIVIQGIEGGMWDPQATGTEPLRRLIDTLRTGIAQSCVPLREAARLTEQSISDNGWAPSDAKITQIEDPTATCSRVDLVPGGLITVVLRGPAG